MGKPLEKVKSIVKKIIDRLKPKPAAAKLVPTEANAKKLADILKSNKSGTVDFIWGNEC